MIEHAIGIGWLYSFLQECLVRSKAQNFAEDFIPSQQPNTK